VSLWQGFEYVFITLSLSNAGCSQRIITGRSPFPHPSGHFLQAQTGKWGQCRGTSHRLTVNLQLLEMSLPVFEAYRRINTLLSHAVKPTGPSVCSPGAVAAGGVRNPEPCFLARHPDTSRGDNQSSSRGI